MRFNGRIRQLISVAAITIMVGCAGSPATRSPWRVQRVQPVPSSPSKPAPSQSAAPQQTSPKASNPTAISPRFGTAPTTPKEKLVPIPTPDPQSRFKPAPLGSIAADTPVESVPTKSQMVPEVKIEARSTAKPSEDISPPRLGFESLKPPTDSPLKLNVTSKSKRPLGEPVTFDVVVTNESDEVMKDVVIDVDFDRHLIFPGRDEKQLQKHIGELMPGESQKMLLTLVSDSLGQHDCHFEVSAAGFAAAKQTAQVTYAEPKLKLQLVGPARRTVGSRAEFTVKVANTSDQAIDDLKVTLNHDAALTPREATGGYQREATALRWTLGRIGPGEGLQLQAEFECRQMSENACVTAEARSESSSAEEIETCVTVVAVPGLLDLRISDRTDPVQIGQEAEYEVTVQNLGLQGINDVQLDLQTSEHLKLGDVDAAIADKRVSLTKSDDFGRVSISLPSALPPDALLRLTIRAKAIKPGDAEFRVVATPGASGTPCEATEFTSVNQ